MAQQGDVFFKPDKIVQIPTKDILSWIFDELGYDPERPVYIDAAEPHLALNARECKTLIRRLIAGLRATPLRQGDCVCVHSFNNIYYPCLFLAVVGAGLVWTGTNPGYTHLELGHHIKTSKAKMIISEPELYHNIAGAAQSCGIGARDVWIFDWRHDQPRIAGAPSWRSLLQYGETDWDRFDTWAAAQRTACRLYSSGTTGLPKAASISHYNLVAQHTLVHEQVHKPYVVSRILCLPFFHAAMVPIGHTTPLRSGHVSYVMRRFELEAFLRHTEMYKITEVFLVPPIIVSIVASPITRKYSLRSVRWGLIGGAALDTSSQTAFNSLIHPDGSINMCWGMTECCCLGAAYYWPEKDTTGSIGRFLPNLEIKQVLLVDDHDQEIRAYHTPGEIWIRGPTVTSGYFDNPSANDASFTADWFRTGDIAYCDETTKKWYIVDRKKELIKVRGFQVAPPELEAVLMSHPQIVDAAVIGVPAQELVDGEAPRAYVVRKPGPDGEQLKAADVKEYVAERLIKYKRLEGGVIFVDSIPKTASGKFLKRELRERARREVMTDPKL